MTNARSSTEDLRIGFVGFGYWGPNLVRNFAAAEGAVPAMLADLDEGRLARARATYPALETTTRYEDILADPSIDAIVIATPIHTHHPVAKAALEAGKHVLCEKPLTAGVDTSEELVDLARRKGLVLMVDHVFIYSPPVQKIKEIVDSGQLGELQFIDSVRINLGLFQHDANVVWDLAPHDLSIVDYVTGRFPKSVSAFGAAHAGNTIEDVGYLNLDLGDGLIANFHVNWLSPVKLRYTMFGGRQKSLVYNHLDPMEKIKVYDSGITVSTGDLEGRRRVLIDYRTGDIWSPHVSGAEPLGLMVSEFISSIREERAPLTDGEAGLRVVRILDAAQRSIKAQGGRITL